MNFLLGQGMRASCSAIIALLFTGMLSAGEAPTTFVKKPTTIRAGARTKIEFTLDGANGKKPLITEPEQPQLMPRLAQPLA